jgi:predicted methyltransferase MtxX (methanogen marker protein 4)
MKKGKKVELYFAKTDYTGKCQEMLLTEVEIKKGVSRALESKNSKLLVGQKRCEIEVPVVEKKEEPKSFIDDLIDKIGNKIKGYFE